MPAHGASNPSRVRSAVSPAAPFRAPNPPPAPTSPSRCRTAQPAVTTERAGARLCVVKLDDAWATRTLWVGVKAGSVLTSDIAKLFDFMSAR